jgi:carboxymethylenebutenolidase
MGEFVTVNTTDGTGTFSAYLAKPAKGSGPGMVVIQEIFGVNEYVRRTADRFAEEGYVVLAPDLFWRIRPGIDLGYSPEEWQEAFGLFQTFDIDKGVEDISATISALRSREDQVGGVGCVGYCLGGKLAFLTAARTDVDASVAYYGVGMEAHVDEAKNVKKPLLFHMAELDAYAPAEAREALIAGFAGNTNATFQVYMGQDHAFAREEGEHYDKPSASMAYGRTMELFHRTIGPIHDLSKLWDDHCYFEFAARDVPATMATMVAQPYVNHIPTMTGGVGAEQLSRFYQWHFVNANPEDTKLIPISRTIGSTSLVDEMLFCFTHTSEIDWMLPGVAPTGKYVEIPLVAIVNFRDDKLSHEHIYWDQASVLVQIGMLDPTGLPVAGIETAKKLVDETLPSNTLMSAWASSEGKKVG